MSKHREQYEKETGKPTSYKYDSFVGSFSNEYVEWLESKLEEAGEENKELKYGNEKRQKEINILHDKLEEAEEQNKELLRGYSKFILKDNYDVFAPYEELKIEQYLNQTDNE